MRRELPSRATLQHLGEMLGGAVADDHCGQCDAVALLRRRVAEGLRPRRVLDLDGEAGALLAELLPEAVPRHLALAVAPLDPLSKAAVTPDGGEMPFPSGRYGLVYGRRTLEACQRPELLLREIRRVLEPGGLFIGEVPQFEPCHRRSRRGLTAYGLKRLAEDAGLLLEELRPGVDGLSLLRRAYERGRLPCPADGAPESALNQEIEARGRAAGRAMRDISLAKLMYSGRIAFVLGRPGESIAAGAAGTAQVAHGARPAGVDRPPQSPASAPGPAANATAAAVPFTDSTDYWRLRYELGYDSGRGSYGQFAAFKAEILNGLFRELALESAVEFGCGDGNQLRLLELPDYMGVDISAVAIERCRAAFRGVPGRRFMLDEDYAGERADAALSLDVIYHLVEDAVFERYMTRLFAAARRSVIVYASNFDAPDGGAAHVRHRRFSDWIERHQRGWRLWRHVPNRFPYRGDHRTGSFADFFVYICAQPGD